MESCGLSDHSPNLNQVREGDDPMTHQITITNESTEKCINLKYSECNAIPVQFGTIPCDENVPSKPTS